MRPEPDDDPDGAGDEGAGDDGAGDTEGGERLSPRAREVKRRIDAGTYEVDLERLADRLLEAEVGEPDAGGDDGEGDGDSDSDDHEPA